jgi:hypothetical protein
VANLVSLEKPAATPVRQFVANVTSLHLPRHLLALLVVLQAVPWLIVAVVLMGNQHAGQEQRPLTPLLHHDGAFSRPGPWGKLEYAEVNLELPDEFVYLPTPDQAPVRWCFAGHTQQRALEFLKSAGLTATQLVAIEQAPWSATADGAVVSPGDELLLALTSTQRGKIYPFLAGMTENNRTVDPVFFHAATLDKTLEQSGLQPESINLLKSCLYPHSDSVLLFADFEPVLRKLTDDDERRRFLKTVLGRKATLARLKFDERCNVETLANYWGAGGRRKDLIPLLNALQRLEGAWGLNVVYLLPHFMRDRLYDYPFPPATANVPKQDCFWSAMNALNDQPDDRFNNMQYVQQVLEKEYFVIPEPTQLGDLVFIAKPDGDAVHAAVFVADDLFFTKNGDHFSQPWVLQHKDDLLETYAIRFPTTQGLVPHYYRRKTL